MKTNLCFLSCVLCGFFISSLLAPAMQLYDDGDNPILLLPVPQTPEGGPRSLEQITASVDVETGTVYINLLSVNETASVSLVNADTLESYNQNAQGGYVTCLFTSGASGLWRLVISLPSGWDYIGEFYL